MTKRNAGKKKEEFIKDSDELPQLATGVNDLGNLIHRLETSERRYRRLFEVPIHKPTTGTVTVI